MLGPHGGAPLVFIKRAPCTVSKDIEVTCCSSPHRGPGYRREETCACSSSNAAERQGPVGVSLAFAGETAEVRKRQGPICCMQRAASVSFGCTAAASAKGDTFLSVSPAVSPSAPRPPRSLRPWRLLSPQAHRGCLLWGPRSAVWAQPSMGSAGIWRGKRRHRETASLGPSCCILLQPFRLLLLSPPMDSC